MRPLRILHIIDHLGQGGAQTFLVNLLKNWPEPSDQISVLGLGRQGDILPHFEDLPEVQTRILKAPRYSLRVLPSLKKIAQSENYDILHAQLPKSILVSLFLRSHFSSRLIAHEHSTPVVPFYYGTFLRSWSRRADAFIANSTSTSAIMSGQYRISPERIHLIHNAIDMERFRPREKDRSILQDLGIPDDHTVIGFIGRLHKQKGLNDLMKALVDVRRQCPKISVIILGDGPQEHWLNDCVERSGFAKIVHRVPYQIDIRPWASVFDMGVIPSTFEPFGIVAVELSAMGIPLVASRTGGLAEIIEHEKTGVLVPPRDPDALAAALSEMIRDPEKCKRFRQAALISARARFTTDSMARAVRSVYLKTLEPST